MHEIYLAILAHLPWWMRAAITVRNWIVAPLGLHAEPAARVWRTETRDAYAPGDRIVRFNVYSADPTELVAGRDDRHLNFRVSVMRVGEPGAENVVVSTLIFRVNSFGKAYLLPVLPLHRIGIRCLLSAASASGRI